MENAETRMQVAEVRGRKSQVSEETFERDWRGQS